MMSTDTMFVIMIWNNDTFTFPCNNDPSLLMWQALENIDHSPGFVRSQDTRYKIFRCPFVHTIINIQDNSCKKYTKT